MLSASEIQKGLAQFYGTDGYTRLSPLHGNLICTDGVTWLAQNADCFWLIDAIASHQPECQKDAMLREHQFWTLKVTTSPTGGRSAKLTCERDEDDVALTQHIEFTDFPLEEVRIWVEYGEVQDKPVMVCLLPSEH
jgi:hypothetical protein